MPDPTPDYLPCNVVRPAFPVLQDTVYLNVGTYGLMPDPALRQFQEWQAEFEQRGVASRVNIGAKAQAARERIAALLNVAREEIAFTRNATDGINLALAGMDWQPGDEVITTDEEHEAMAHPLLYLQRARGIKAHFIDVSPDPAVMLARIEAVATARTRLVAMSHVTCETGTRLPAREICDWARSRGIWSLFDGAQAFGAFAVDVRGLGCDFYTINGHKWFGGPKGTGIFWGRKDRLVELLPAHVGAGSLERADIAAGVADLWQTAARFEFGTRAQAVYAGLNGSLDWFESLGWDAVYRHVAALNQYLKAQIMRRPHLELLTPQAPDASSGLVSFVVRERVAGDVSRRLSERRIVVRVIPHFNAIRISTAHFNCACDINELMSAIDGL